MFEEKNTVVVTYSETLLEIIEHALHKSYLRVDLVKNSDYLSFFSRSN